MFWIRLGTTVDIILKHLKKIANDKIDNWKFSIFQNLKIDKNFTKKMMKTLISPPSKKFTRLFPPSQKYSREILTGKNIYVKATSCLRSTRKAVFHCNPFLEKKSAGEHPRVCQGRGRRRNLQKSFTNFTRKNVWKICL